MPTQIITTLVPAGDGNFPIVEDKHVKGGFQIVANAGARDAIPTASRKEGMLVFDKNASRYYVLGFGLTNSDWYPTNLQNYTIPVTLVSSNYTVLYSDNFVAVDTTAARTITLPGTPQLGHEVIIKDATGTANAFNITIQPNGKLTDGYAPNRIISSDYGSLRFIYNGTQWNVI